MTGQYLGVPVGSAEEGRRVALPRRPLLYTVKRRQKAPVGPPVQHVADIDNEAAGSRGHVAPGACVVYLQAGHRIRGQHRQHTPVCVCACAIAARCPPSDRGPSRSTLCDAFGQKFRIEVIILIDDSGFVYGTLTFNSTTPESTLLSSASGHRCGDGSMLLSRGVGVFPV